MAKVTKPPKEDCLHMIFVCTGQKPNEQQTRPSCILIFSIVLHFKQPKKKIKVEEYNYVTWSSNLILGEQCGDIYKCQWLFVKVSSDHPLYSLFLTHRNMWHLLHCGHFPSWSPVCGYYPLKGLEHMWKHMHPLSRLPFFWFLYGRDALRAYTAFQEIKTVNERHS